MLRINQLLAAAKLASGNVVLHTCDHHRNDSKWLGHAGDFRRHPDLHDLSLDLAETGLQRSITGALGDQDAGWKRQGIDDVADPQKNCSTRPLTPARITVLPSST